MQLVITFLSQLFGHFIELKKGETAFPPLLIKLDISTHNLIKTFHLHQLLSDHLLNYNYDSISHLLNTSISM